MVKYYCDYCGAEITGANTRDGGRLKTTINNGRGCSLGVEVIESCNGASNHGHFCRYCVLDAIAKLDDRPKESP